MFSNREKMALNALKALGVNQHWGIRYGPYLFLLIILGIASGLYLHDFLRPYAWQIKGLATPLVTVSALLLAFHQWKHLRNEVSISGSLDRLDIVNSYFRNSEHDDTIRFLFGNEPTWDDGIEDRQEWDKRIYIYMELDNLQYALEKYRLGYSSAYQAMRVVDVFAARCKSETFLTMAQQLVSPKAGSYTRETCIAVSRLKIGQRFHEVLNAR